MRVIAPLAPSLTVGPETASWLPARADLKMLSPSHDVTSGKPFTSLVLVSSAVD